jgi:hypothetical protein
MRHLVGLFYVQRPNPTDPGFVSVFFDVETMRFIWSVPGAGSFHAASLELVISAARSVYDDSGVLGRFEGFAVAPSGTAMVAGELLALLRESGRIEAYTLHSGPADRRPSERASLCPAAGLRVEVVRRLERDVAVIRAMLAPLGLAEVEVSGKRHTFA